MIRELAGIVADLGRAAAHRLDRWLLDLHQPGEDGTCSAHHKRTPWPCQDFDDACERRADRRRDTRPERRIL